MPPRPFPPPWNRRGAGRVARCEWAGADGATQLPPGFVARPPAGMALTQMQPRSPGRRSLIGLGLQHNAAEVSLLAGYTINVSRLANCK